MKSRTDWKKIKSMTEKEIIAAAMSDPDSPPLTNEQLNKFKRVHFPENIDVKLIRNKLHLSKE